MTKKKGQSGTIDVKALLAGDEEFLRALLRTALQEVLEVEMAEAVGAEKGERTPRRLGYRSGYMGEPWSPGSASSSCACRRTALDGSRPNCSNAISARSGRWWRRWRRCTCRGSRPGK